MQVVVLTGGYATHPRLTLLLISKYLISITWNRFLFINFKT
jgi:NDP-sugar pyrophosphorylase family protein